MEGPIKCVQRVRNRLLDPDGPIPPMLFGFVPVEFVDILPGDRFVPIFGEPFMVDEPGTEINVGTIKPSLTASYVRVKQLEKENRDLRLLGLLQLDELRERILGQGKFHVTDPAKVEAEYERRKKEWESS